MGRDGLTDAQSLANLVNVLRCLARSVTVFALCCAIGLQWVAIQSIAWTTMLIKNSRRASLCNAITQTFDGSHPCSLCHLVTKGKTSEKKSDVRSATPKLDIICVTRIIPLLPRFVPFEYALGDCSLLQFEHSPPIPPPRLSLS
jgi:hypothetical protein